MSKLTCYYDKNLTLCFHQFQTLFNDTPINRTVRNFLKENGAEFDNHHSVLDRVLSEIVYLADHTAFGVSGKIAGSFESNQLVSTGGV